MENFITLGKTVLIDFFRVEIKMCHKVLCSHKDVVGKKKRKKKALVKVIALHIGCRVRTSIL